MIFIVSVMTFCPKKFSGLVLGCRKKYVRYTIGVTVNNMRTRDDDFYCAAIKSIFPGSWNVRVPVVSGAVCPVFLCDTPNGTQVCRFSNRNIVFRNKKISDLLVQNGVPMPDTTVRAYMGAWFETYEYCSAPTLYERMRAGMTDAEIFDVYKRATDIQHQISEIAPASFNPGSCKNMHEIFRETQAMRVCPSLAYTYGAVHRLLSSGGAQHVLHNDLHNKNILVDSENRFVRLIDLDSVALCNESFSVMITLRSYPLTNLSEYMDYYEDTMGRKLNRAMIMTGLKILGAVRRPQIMLNHIMWRGHCVPPCH